MTAWLLLGVLGAVSVAQNDGGAVTNRVYVMSNLAEGNTIVVYNRAADGSLTLLQEVATGGFGSGPGLLPPPRPPFGGAIPLDSQNALVLTQDGRFLLAVNANSNDVSVFHVSQQGIELVDRRPSLGSFPVAIAEYQGLVYVGNAGQSPDELPGATPVISGFRLDPSGKLQPIPNARVTAGAADASIADLVFSPDGRYLVMTELNGNNVDLFAVDENGRATPVQSLPANNLTPFGAEFRPDGILTIVETDDTAPRVAIPGGASMSSYRITAQGTLEPISKAVPNGQTAACWVRMTPDGRFAFSINAGSSTISTYNVAADGELTLKTAVTFSTGTASVPIDSDITPDGQFLYVLTAFSALQGHISFPLPLEIAEIQIFHIEQDGSLTHLGTVGGLPFTLEGIAVR